MKFKLPICLLYIIGLISLVDSTNDDESGRPLLTSAIRQICPKGFLRLGYSCYYFSGKMKSWQQSYFSCRKLNSTLFNVDSHYEDKMIRNYLNKPQLARLNRWIGGFYNWISEQWIWGSTGLAMDYSGFSTGDIPSVPDWQCSYMSPSLFYRWNHASCMSRMHYICKAPQTTINN